MKYYKKTDKTRPRFRQSKFRYNLINRELYEKFIEKTGIQISWTEFKDISGSISDELVKMVIEERDGVALPKGMGNVYLAMYPFSEKALTYLREKARDDIYHHFFKEFDGKITWDFRNVRYKVKNRNYYSFKPHRTFKTMAHIAFLENPERYKRVRKHDMFQESQKVKKTLEDEDIAKRGHQSDQSSEQGS